MSSIITTSDLDAFTQKTLSPAVSSRIVKAVNAYIERVTGRCWGDTATARETHDFGQHVWLKHQDVRSIVRVRFGHYGNVLTELPSTEYHVSPLGRLSFFTGYAHRRNRTSTYCIEVTYAYGVDEVPDDLKLAALGIAAGFYNWATNGQKEASASQVGSYRVEYAGSRRSADAVDTAAESNFTTVASYATKRL